MIQKARKRIYEQQVSLSVRRAAWMLFEHELGRINPSTSKPFTVSRALTNVLRWMAGQKAKQDFKQLSPRQREVVALMVEGFSQKQMALEMGCGHRTIKRYLWEIRRKIKVISNYQVVAIAVDRGWVKAPQVDEQPCYGRNVP